MGLTFPDTVSSLGLGHRDHHPLGTGTGLEHGLPGVGDATAFGQSTAGSTPGPDRMSSKDITSRLESLCLSMTEGVLGVSCTNY